MIGIGLVTAAAFCCFKVDGVSMDISPPSIILNYASSEQSAKTIFRCWNPSSADIVYLSVLKISRLTRREAGGIPQVIVIIRQGDSPVIPATIPDIQNRATAGGAIYKAPYSQAFVSVEFNTVDLQCDDVGQYFCELNYQDARLNSHREESSMNFTASALPSDITLTAKIDGFKVDGSQNFPANMSVGQEIELTCAGTIGVDPNTELQWAKTGNTGNLIKFQPQAYPGIAIETQEPATLVTGQCTLSRRATLKYNVTTTDKSSIGTLQFQCYVEVTLFLGGIPYRANSTTTFYIEFDRTLETSSTTPSPSKNFAATHAPIIAVVAGVFGAIIVTIFIVLMIWRKPNRPELEVSEPRYEIPNRSNQSSEEREYASINSATSVYENS